MFTRRDTDDGWELSNKIIAQFLTLVSPFLAAAALWRWSNGFAMAVMMTSLTAVCYLFTAWYRLTFLPPPLVNEVRRSRRRARTAFWRHEIQAAAKEPGKRGDLARSIVKSWNEVEADAFARHPRETCPREGGGRDPESVEPRS